MTTKTTLLASVAAIALISSTAEAGTLFLATLSGANEIPANPSTATGTGVLILNDAKTSATVTGTHTVPAATVVAGHIHRGASTINGPVIFPFAAPVSPIGPLIWAIPAADVVNLETGGLYFNIHSQSRPGGEIRGNFFRAVLATSAVNDTQRGLANALDVSAGFSADLDQVLISTNLLSSATAKAQALDDISARSVYVQGRNAIETMGSLNGSLLSRSEDQRLGGTKTSTGGSMFITGGYDFGKRSATAKGSGSKIQRPYIVAGYDYAMGSNASAGLALGYADGEDKLSNGGGRSKVKTTSLQGFFASELSDNVALDGSLGYGWVKVNTTRAITSLARTATSAPKGTTWSGVLKLSTQVDVGGDAVMSPYVLVDHQNASIKGYAETGAGALGLVVPKLKTKNSAAEIGATFASPAQQSWGVLTPRLTVGAHYVFDETGGAFSTQLVGSTVAFATPVQHPGKTAAHVEASISAAMTTGMVASVGYRGLVGASDQSNHALEARVSFKF